MFYLSIGLAETVRTEVRRLLEIKWLHGQAKLGIRSPWKLFFSDLKIG
jgi:hypothetical protein